MLGAALIKSLAVRLPDAQFCGVGGEPMTAVGLQQWSPSSTLSVMGITEVLKQLPRLLRFRKQLAQRICGLSIICAKQQQKLIFVGIDAPDFNLGLAKQLKAKSCGITTVHLVSPSVWAWRKGRIKSIHQSVDLILPLFPFEQSFYEKEGIKVACIGHPLADQYPLEPQPLQQAREAVVDQVSLSNPEEASCLKVAALKKWVAVLPGSRGGEIQYLGPVFLEAIRELVARDPELLFIVPMVNARRRAQFERLLSLFEGQTWLQTVRVVDGCSQLVMAASDVVLTASGTATLEAMLLKKPMVVCYKWHPITHLVIGSAVKVPYVSLPNLLFGGELVPELIQERCRPELIIDAVLGSFAENSVGYLIEQYTKIHRSIRLKAADQAADTIIDHFLAD